MSAPEPRITISSLDDLGVLLLSSSHPDFAAGLKPGRAPEFNRISSYTVVIKNSSGKGIIAYTVLWNCTGLDGKTATQTRSVFNFFKLAKGPNLPSGASELVSISPVIEAGNFWDVGTEEFVNGLVDFYSHQKRIQVSLDAVLFSDGSASGPNHSHWIDKWRAWLDAERDVFTQAVEASPAKLSHVLQLLAEPALGIHRLESGSDPENSGVLSVMADRSTTYEECLALAKGYFAFSMLKESNEGGPEIMMNNIRNILQSKQYPNVHRKEQTQ